MSFSDLILSAFLSILSILARFFHRLRRAIRRLHPPPMIRTANYHFLRSCPYTCQYCFYPDTNSSFLPLPVALRGLRLLRAAGFSKITFSGGEPFMHPKHLAAMVRACKEEMGFPVVSVVTNGALVREAWMEENGWAVDVMSVSCDSFVVETNVRIGRAKGERDRGHVERVFKLREWCAKQGVVFKLNTTVSKANAWEDMREPVQALKPQRWKVFQCLPVPGENCGEGAPRDASDLFITQQEYAEFLARHEGLCSDVATIPEPNVLMRNSYCIVDQNMSILRNDDERKIPTRSILEVGVEAALEEAKLDVTSFKARGGEYKVVRPAACGASVPDW
eukprot:CAMPEP_0184721944 /NCGR_PEP_ID=MMETSP0314-20130426/20459_1 /TAXON_ID=38298 /ORGANISM="Rhodella maculata, Strain CCMP 736" /LENGTH=334 /DNA_ID=CAMNT_0027186401 /DNA_START=61 /DNA_END=1065 /DNA_ORIENTATION=-